MTQSYRDKYINRITGFAINKFNGILLIEAAYYFFGSNYTGDYIKDFLKVYEEMPNCKSSNENSSLNSYKLFNDNVLALLYKEELIRMFYITETGMITTNNLDKAIDSWKATIERNRLLAAVDMEPITIPKKAFKL